jgi:hypothetical protein
MSADSPILVHGTPSEVDTGVVDVGDHGLVNSETDEIRARGRSSRC